MALIRGENSIFFALGLDHEQLEKDAEKASGAISSMAKDIARLGEEASDALKESLKEALQPGWLYSQRNALIDELNKVLGVGLKFDATEFEKLSKALNAAGDDLEQTVVFWDFLQKKLKESKGSSEGLKELSSGMKLLEDHFQSMGVSAAEVMRKVEKALSNQGSHSKQNPLAGSLKAIQADAQKYLPQFSAEAIGKLKGSLSEVLGKELKLDNKGFGALDKLLRSSKDELQRLVALSGFFKEKLLSLGKDSSGLKRLSGEIQGIEKNLKESGVAVESLYGKLKKKSFSLSPNAKGPLPYDQMAGAQLSASIRGMQAYKQSIEGVKTSEASLQAQYRATVSQMALLRKEGKEQEQQYEQLKTKAAELKSVLSSTYKEIDLSSKSSQGLNSVLSSLQGLVGVFGAAQGVSALFGDGGKELEKTLIKLNGVLAILNSLQSVQTSLSDKNSAAFRALTKVKGLYSVAADRAAAATTRLAAASKLLGWGLIVAGIVAAVKAFENLSEKIKEKTAAARLSIDVQRQAQKSAADEITHLKLLTQQAQNEKLSRDLRIKALGELKNGYPQYLNFLSLENIRSKKAATAIDQQTQAILRRAKARAYEEKMAEVERKKIEALSRPDEDYLGWGDKLRYWAHQATAQMYSYLPGSEGMSQGQEKAAQKFARDTADKQRAKLSKKYDQELTKLQELMGKDLSLGEIDFASEKHAGPKEGKNPFQSIIKQSEEARDKVKEAVKDIEHTLSEGYEKIQSDKEQRRIDAMAMGFDKEKAYLDKERYERERAIEKEKTGALEKIQTLEKYEEHARKRLEKFKAAGLERQASREKTLIQEIEEKKKHHLEQSESWYGRAIGSAGEQYFEQLAKLQEKYKEGSLSALYEKKKALESELPSLQGREAIAESQEEINKIQDQIDALEGKKSVVFEIIDAHKRSLSSLNQEIEKQKGIVAEKRKAFELSRQAGASIKAQKTAYKDLKEAEKEQNELLEARARKLQDIAGWINFGAYHLKELFSSMGMDQNSPEGKKLQSALDFIGGAADAAAGFASGNIGQGIAGTVKALGVLFKGEVVSDTKKYEGAIRDLGDAFSLLQMKMQRAIGEEKIENFQAQIKNHQEKIKQLGHAAESERRARKTYVWGLFKGGRGGATDWNKVREFEKQSQEEYEKMLATQERYREFLTATSENTVVDHLVAALEKGKESMKSFQESFDQMIRGVFMRKIKTDLIERQAQEFFHRLNYYTESGGKLEAWEIDRLSDYYKYMEESAKSAMDRYGKVMERAGIAGGFTSKSKKEGLSGQIKSVTEETAGKLEGLLHNVRISQDHAIGVAQRMEEHLRGVYQNTGHLRIISQRLFNIEKWIAPKTKGA